MSDRIDIVMKALRTGALSDRLNAEAEHALAGTTSVSSMVAIMREAAAHITELEAQLDALTAELDALKNPPYRVETGVETLGDNVGGDCWWAIYNGDTLVLEEWGFDTTEEARVEGERVKSRLTAPFSAKE